MSTTPLAGPVTRLARTGKHSWARSGWIILACLATFVLVAKFAKLPTTPATPNGLELEIPGTADGALAIMRALVDTDPHNLDHARSAIFWDFLLILSYSIGLATLLEWLATRDPDNTDPLIGYAAWGALLAGAADIIENLSMLTLISKYEHDPQVNLGFPALVSTIASLTKWTLLCAVVGYTVWELAKRLVRFLRRRLTRSRSKESHEPPLSSLPE